MISSVPGHGHTPDAKKMAAVIAAVQTYLNEETSERVTGAKKTQRLWKMELWPQLRRGAPWRGRD